MLPFCPTNPAFKRNMRHLNKGPLLNSAKFAHLKLNLLASKGNRFESQKLKQLFVKLKVILRNFQLGVLGLITKTKTCTI